MLKLYLEFSLQRCKKLKSNLKDFYLKKKIGKTEYGVGWLPLGGYVKISGMIDESMDKEQMALPPQPWEFRSKPSWQRLINLLRFTSLVKASMVFTSPRRESPSHGPNTLLIVATQ